ncbi:agamous-like MADS-box protein AGL29 [Cynara cardunculus var. scolymus]|uniref:Transcription factor, MADS-box n=1 Tax=Cynara cardunculus var. scolymus TaxID=59895 RepID=A0A103Y0D0_CYNCS|nr:agamous-like MADS-box protein AGL29 [Cynara cardunculus var. scolymus]KVI00200.1 Transcription factor, MADS-box [Cynara cardunculus var. scolymus]
MVTANVAGGVSMNKKTKGRKKIEIKKIQAPNSRQVTFSKRRAGLFRKASELCVLTGAQIGIFVNSPGGRVFAFGHPNADLLADRYLNQNNIDATSTTVQNYQPPLPAMHLFNFNEHYVKVSRELEMEKKRRELIPAERSSGLQWYEEAVEGMEVEELEQYLSSLELLKKKVVMRADELTMIKKTSTLLGSNLFDQVGWNNHIQTMDIPTTTTTTTTTTTVHHDGFNFHHSGEIGKF